MSTTMHLKRGVTLRRRRGAVQADATTNKKAQTTPQQAVKLAKALADAGVASRRACEQLVLDGRVQVNGEYVTNVAARVLPSFDSVSVDGQRVRGKGVQLPRRYYFAVNKPRGYICSHKSSEFVGSAKQNKRVVDLLESFLQSQQKQSKRNRSGDATVSAQKKPAMHKPPAEMPRLFFAGRLDVNTEGLVIVTNDGEWANKVCHPSNEIIKEYVVTAQHWPTWRQLTHMLNDGAIVEGAHVVPLRCDRLEPTDGGSANRIVIEVLDGRKHEVRELCKQHGIEIARLKRVRVGGLKIPSSISHHAGRTVELQPHEVKQVTSKEAMRNAETNSYAPPVV